MALGFQVRVCRAGTKPFSYVHFTLAGRYTDSDILGLFRRVRECADKKALSVYVVDLTDAESRLSAEGFGSVLREIKASGVAHAHFAVITNAPEDEHRYDHFLAVAEKAGFDVEIKVLWSDARLRQWLEMQHASKWVAA